MSTPLTAVESRRLASLKRLRSSAVANGTQEVTRLDALLSEDQCRVTAVRESVIKLKQYHDKVLQYTESVQELLIDDADLAHDGVTFEPHIQKFLDSHARGLAIIQSLETPAADRIGGAGSLHDSQENLGSGHGVGASRTSLHPHTHTSLPKINDMKYFSGDVLEWMEFWDWFENTVHNTDISAVHKFTYLKHALKKDAAKLVANYRLTSACYEEAVDQLQQRYGNREVIKCQHFEALISLPPSNNQIDNLQRTVDEVELHIRSLVALGVSEDTYGLVFCPILLAKLPPGIRIELQRKQGLVPWTIVRLRELLREELMARDLSYRLTTHRPQTSEAPRQNNSAYFRNRSSGSALVTSEKPMAGQEKERKETSRKRSCIFCSGEHYNDACTVVTDIEDRANRLANRCLKCLRRSHRAEDCRIAFPCAYCKSREHNRCLCPKRGSAAAGTSRLQQTKSVKGKAATAIVATRGKRGILHTAVASVSGNKSSVKARLMLDSCATDSFIRIGLANKIGAQKIGREMVDHGAFEGKRVPEYRSVFTFQLKLIDGSEMEVQAYGSEQITPDIYKPAINVHKHPILAHVPLAEPLINEGEMVSVDVLLGTDYREEILREERLTLGNDLYLLDSKLGYVITGRINGEPGVNSTVNVCTVRSPDPHVDFERLYSLDQIGIRDTNESNDDEESVASFNHSLQFDNYEQRYYAKWPIRQFHQKLPSNFGVAYGRLKSFKRKAEEIPQLLENAKTIFADQLSKEVIEVAPQTPDGEQCHYLPFQAVVTPQKTTTKCRIVYDASSKANKQLPSLNDILYRGPVLLENLIGLILRFRLQKVGVVSDIEKAFLQIGLQKPDRDLVRFLWLHNPDEPVSEDNIVAMRFRRVCFGAVSSPFILAATVDHHLKRTGTETAVEIARNIYVDNVIRSVPSSAAAKSYYSEAKQIFNKASMNLREWYSNDKAFMKGIPEIDRGEGDYTKVLGLRWDLSKDTLACPIKVAEDNSKPTKRFVLHVLAKVYDPCGFYTPVTSPGKWILQKLWLLNLGWDESIPEDLGKAWSQISNNLDGLPNGPIPRCYNYSASLSECQFEMHAFCDASEKAYAAAFYLVMKPAAGEPSSSLIFSKCRVSPIKKQKQTIPRLELLAATIGARLLEFLVGELGLHLTAKYLWSDSKCVLYWILGTPVSTVFVRNRVDSIRKVSGTNYRYVPSADNPADLPTRGVSVDELKELRLWWHGPPWLVTPEKWPETPTRATELQPEDNEAVIFGPTVAVVTGLPPDVSCYLIDPSRFSRLQKLFRITAWIKRFIRNCRKKVQRERQPGSTGHHPKDVSEPADLSANELKDARAFWEKSVQHNHFAEFLVSNGTKLGTLKHLAPLVIDPGGVIRCVSRLQHAQLSEAAKAPKLLPKSDPFTQLLIQHYHESLNHVGIKHTLAEIRCEYWIIHGRSQVKQVLRRCCHCQQIKGKPFRMPEVPTLPEFRVAQQAPFTCTGLDYLGPLYVFSKSGDSSKVWICLFTCASTRAIHLEVVSSMNTNQFLLALRRFMAVYGTPKLLVSDNAGQFHTSRRVLDKLWQEACQGSDVRVFSANSGIEWKFITQAAPWMGGFYERLVGLVKSNLKSALFRQRLDLVELQTVVCEVCSIVNSRPLVYCEDEVGDEALTPSHLLMRHRSVTPLQIDSESNSTTRNEWILSWKRIQNILARFWKSWQKQYLLSLRESHRPRAQRNVLAITPQVGEVVLIAEEHMPRSAWKYGRVTELVMSADDRCRTVKLLLPGRIPLTRPVKLLYPLELRDVKPQTSSITAVDASDQTVARQLNTNPNPFTNQDTAVQSQALDMTQNGARDLGISCLIMSISNFIRVYSDRQRKDPLGRFAVCSKPFSCGFRPNEPSTEADPTSLHMAAVYCVLRQHEMQSDVSLPPGQTPLSVEFLDDKKVRETPFGSITPWLQRKHLEFSPEISGNMHRIYLAVLIHQVRHEVRNQTGNEYAQTMLRIVREANNAPTFVAMGTDKVWTVGTSQEVLGDEDFCGGNALGQVLSRLAKLMFENELDTFDGLTIDHMLYLPTYRYPLAGGQSVLVLSDSGGRLIDFIQQGRVFRIGGKTMGEVAEAAEKEGINLSCYRWIIVTGFTNDARKSTTVWETSFAQLQSFLGPEIERRGHRACSTILYSLELPPANIKNSREHLAWIREKLTSYDIAVQDWSDGCMFVDSNGQRVEKFFDDAIHLNELGMYCQWRNWSNFFESELQMLKIRLEAKYAAERGEGGTRGDHLRRMPTEKAREIRKRKNKARKRRKLRNLIAEQREKDALPDLQKLLSIHGGPEPGPSASSQTLDAIEIVDNIGKRRRIIVDSCMGIRPIEVIDTLGNRRVVTGLGQVDA